MCSALLFQVASSVSFALTRNSSLQLAIHDLMTPSGSATTLFIGYSKAIWSQMKTSSLIEYRNSISLGALT